MKFLSQIFSSFGTDFVIQRFDFAKILLNHSGLISAISSKLKESLEQIDDSASRA